MIAEQSELDLLAETELNRLQLQLRKIHSSLESLLHEKRNSFLKQEKVIELLQKEHENLKNETYFLEKKINGKKQKQVEKNFEKIIETFKDHQNKLKLEKVTFLELESHIKKIEREISILRKNEVPDICYKETIKKGNKSIVKLENRLDVVNKKCNDVLTEILKLRGSIDHTLQDRTHFNEMWQSMVNQFNEGKKYIMDLVDQSTLAFDHREELCTKLQALKDRSETEKMLHMQEMREVQRKLEYDAKLQQFYAVKGLKRINSELEARELNKKLKLKDDIEKQLEEYQSLIGQIKIITNENIIDKIKNQFSTQEEENFALFKYVNELGHEVEILNESVEKLCIDIEKQHAEFEEMEIKKKTETVGHLQKLNNSLQTNLQLSIRHKEEVQIELKFLLKGIEYLFRLLNCKDIAILNVLGCKNYITLFNVNLFLGIVSKSIKNLVTNINTDDIPNKILSKKDRVPKFNVKDSAKQNIK